NPTVKRGPFTDEEDKKILAAHAVYGNKWAVISRSIPGRYVHDTPRHPPSSPHAKFDTSKSNADRSGDSRWPFVADARTVIFRVKGTPFCGCRCDGIFSKPIL
ncbi:SANT/Myb-like DNA-binding domain-containing protein, partial [bacterium]|nr:SANT/Myb-like DNA-binding domain-containing protein [bacterium]